MKNDKVKKIPLAVTLRRLPLDNEDLYEMLNDRGESISENPDLEEFIEENFDKLLAFWFSAGIYQYMYFLDYLEMQFEKGTVPEVPEISDPVLINEVNEVLEYLKNSDS